MNYTQSLVNMFNIITFTFTEIYNFFSLDLGELTGLPLLDGFSIIEAMFGAGLVTVLTYTLVKWVTGIIT